MPSEHCGVAIGTLAGSRRLDPEVRAFHHGKCERFPAQRKSDHKAGLVTTKKGEGGKGKGEGEEARGQRSVHPHPILPCPLILKATVPLAT
jgi:hypothetical protein